jgi:hypothetical protein
MRALEAGESRRVAEYVDGNGSNIGLYVWRTADGRLTCLTTAKNRTGLGGGGCNPANDFFAGKPFVVSLGFEGGPEPASMTEAVLTGLVTGRVARIEVVTSAGSREEVELTPDGAFVWKAPHADLVAGIAPAAVVAYGADGSELGSESVAASG